MLKQKILILQEHLFADTGANPKLIFQICYQLQTLGYDVSILGIAHAKEELVPEYNGIHLIHEPANKVKIYYGVVSRFGNFKRLRYILYPRSIKYRIHQEHTPYYIEMRDWLNRHIEEYDVMIACCSPYYPLALAAEFAHRIPVIYYKMDPVATISHKEGPDNSLTTVENEIAWDNVAMCIITTDVIFKYYNQLPTKVNAHKVVLANYPGVHERKLSATTNAIAQSLEPDKLHLFFIGKFYREIRHPQYLFDIMERLSSAPIVLHIVGPIEEMRFDQAYVDKYLSNKIPNIRVHGAVFSVEADDLLLHADVLVHVGNAVDSLMPSKILDYISSGKPILNLCKIRTCPTLPLMEKYPLGMTLFEEEPLSDEKVESVKRFCEDNKGKQVPYAEIEKLYPECTIEYVGRQFDETIQVAINEFNNKSTI